MHLFSLWLFTEFGPASWVYTKKRRVGMNTIFLFVDVLLLLLWLGWGRRMGFSKRRKPWVQISPKKLRVSEYVVSSHLTLSHSAGLPKLLGSAAGRFKVVPANLAAVKNNPPLFVCFDSFLGPPPQHRFVHSHNCNKFNRRSQETISRLSPFWQRR